MKPNMAWVFTLLLFAAFISLPAVAQDTQGDAAEKTEPTKTADESPIETAISEVQASMDLVSKDASLDEAVKTKLQSTYQKAIEALGEAKKSRDKAAGYRDALMTAPTLTAKTREQLEKLPPTEEVKAQPASDTKELRTQVDSERGVLAALNEQLSKLTAEANDSGGRLAKISERTPKAQAELATVRKQISDLKSSEDLSSGRKADLKLLQANELRLNEELEMLRAEQASHSVRQQLGQAKTELLTKQINDKTEIIRQLESAVQHRVTQEAKEIGSIADIAQLQVADDDKQGLELVKEVSELAKQLETAAAAQPIVTEAHATLKEEQKRLTERYEGITQQLGLGGTEREMAQVLVELRDLLKSRSAEIRLAASRTNLSTTRLDSLRVDFKLSEQRDIEAKFANRDDSAIKQLVKSRAELLHKLKRTYQDLTPELSAFDTDTRTYLKHIEVIEEDIGNQLFWIRICPPLGIASISRLPSDALWVFEAEHYTELVFELTEGYWRTPIFCSLVLILAIVLLLMRRRIAGALELTSQPVRRISTDNYRYTAQAIFLSILLAAPVPLVFGLFTWLLYRSSDPSHWLLGVSRGSWHALGILCVAILVNCLCRRDGVCLVHLRWPPGSVRQLRKATRRLAFIHVPLAILTFSTIFQSNSMYLSGIGRMAFIVAQIGTLVVLWQLLMHDHGLLNMVKGYSSRLINGLRYVWGSLTLLFPVALIWLAVEGYMVTAIELDLGFVATLSVVTAGAFLYGFSLRYFSINQRKLALQEAIERRRARQAEQESDGTDDENIVIDQAEQELNLDSIGQQTRQMLGVTFSLVVALMVVSVWSGMLPVVDAMREIEIPMTGGMNLLTMIQAGAIAVVTWVAMKNLPGVLELAILRMTTIDSGTRTAIITICQYAVAGVGMFMMFNVLQLDWSKFGWIAGGLSVGIGFGLQEVVANFICGLILLFERPVRVGDVVTVEGELGTVTRIHLRSTTITNFDRGEVVFPNKTFITGKLINWTLTAPLNRVVVNVAVALGTDTDAARQILLSLAEEHPNVLDDPAPMTMVDKFNEYSLNLVLRAYLPDRSNRDGTISELHSEIHKRFQAAGVEIPFPQRDIQIRSESGERVAGEWADQHSK